MDARTYPAPGGEPQADDLRAAAAALASRTPDHVLAQVVRAIPSGAGRVADLRAVFEAEQRRRRARDAVFNVLLPLARSAPTSRLPSDVAETLWRLAVAEREQDCKALTQASLTRAAEALEERRDPLCLALSSLLADSDSPSSAQCREALEKVPGGADAARLLLALSPRVRATAPKLGGWVHHLTQKSASELRAAYAKSCELGEEAGPLFIEAVAAQLPEYSQALRLLALLLDRPSEASLAAAGLTRIPEQLIEQAEHAVEAVSGFAPGHGASAGAAVGAAARSAVMILLEFDQWLDIQRSGAWAARLAAARRALAVGVEAQLKAAPRGFGAALPTRQLRWAHRSAPRAPQLGREPDLGAAACAEDLAAFMAELRGAPSTSGFAALRDKITDQLQGELDDYIESAVDLLHNGPAEDRPRLRAYLDVAARIAGAFGGESAGSIVRRRAAAA